MKKKQYIFQWVCVFFFYSFALNAQSVSLDLKQWQTVKYKNIKANSVQNSNQHLNIKVQSSSSVLIQSWPKARTIKSIALNAELKGDINYDNKKPGVKAADDFPLRLGFVKHGQHKLNFWQSFVAPQWLKQINKLSKRHGGLDKIITLIFYTQTPDFEQRTHPMSEFFIEKASAQFKQGELQFSQVFDEAIEGVVGLWLSSDGDDTQSNFELTVQHLELN